MTAHAFRPRCATLTAAIAVCLATAVWSSHAAAQELLGYWKLEETDVAAEAVDSSGNGLNGIYLGDVDPNVEGAPGFGSGAHFDGISAEVLIGPGDETGFGDLTSNFSVMAWINPEQFIHKNRVFGSAPHGGAGWGWGTIGDSLEITTWSVRDYDQPVPLELDTWTHAAIVLDENFEAHFYVNGEFVGSQSHPSEGFTTFNDFYIGYACCADEHFEGRLDEVAVFSGTLTEEQIVNAMTCGADKINDCAPVDPWERLNDPTFTDPTERANYVHNVLNSWLGDSNHDREFNTADLVAVFQAGEYEDAITANSKWETGDWSGDQEFNTGDLVVAFQDGGFEAGPRPPAAAVPEPSALVSVLIAVGALLGVRRR